MLYIYIAGISIRGGVCVRTTLRSFSLLSIGEFCGLKIWTESTLISEAARFKLICTYQSEFLKHFQHGLLGLVQIAREMQSFSQQLLSFALGSRVCHGQGNVAAQRGRNKVLPSGAHGLLKRTISKLAISRVLKASCRKHQSVSFWTQNTKSNILWEKIEQATNSAARVAAQI
jgi:hypothetical protein